MLKAFATLIKQGVSLSAKNDAGQTPLDILEEHYRMNSDLAGFGQFKDALRVEIKNQIAHAANGEQLQAAYSALTALGTHSSTPDMGVPSHGLTTAVKATDVRIKG